MGFAPLAVSARARPRRERVSDAASPPKKLLRPTITPRRSISDLIRCWLPMADVKTSRMVLRLETLSAQFQQRLDNEAGVLEVLVGGMAKGQPVEALWNQFHEAAVRDE